MFVLFYIKVCLISFLSIYGLIAFSRAEEFFEQGSNMVAFSPPPLEVTHACIRMKILSRISAGGDKGVAFAHGGPILVNLVRISKGGGPSAHGVVLG